MIDIRNFPFFSNNQSTLKETSKDDHDGTVCYMTESLLPAINFDGVKEEYIRALHVHESPKSNDALVILPNRKAVFIEFKNGKMTDKKVFSVRKKILDSMLIFTDIVGVGITQTRVQMEYILVYNEDVNPDPADDPETNIQSSENRDSITRIFSRLANEEFVKFGLKAFEKYCFHKVHTYSKEEFERHFVQSIS